MRNVQKGRKPFLALPEWRNKQDEDSASVAIYAEIYLRAFFGELADVNRNMLMWIPFPFITQGI